MSIAMISRRVKAVVIISAMIASLCAVVVPSVGAYAAPSNPDKVTICHRTHATNNPYRMITISKSSVDGPLNPRSSGSSSNAAGDHAGIVHNKHNQGGSFLTEWDPDFPIYNTQKIGTNANDPVVAADNPVRVFDPSYPYTPNKKMWEDIIPPFTSGGVNFAGLNWTEKGKAIYYGQTLNGVNYAGLCKKMGARQYYDSEVGTGAGQGGQTPNNVLDDIKDQGNTTQDGTFNSRPNLSDLPSEVPDNKGPKSPSKLNDLITNLQTQNNGKSANQMTQAIAGVVWYDDNRDGVQDVPERLAQGVGIVLKDPSGNLYTVGYKNTASKKIKLAQYLSTKKPIFGFASTTGQAGSMQLAATVLTVTTDADGYFQFPSVPEGEWQVVVVTPSGYSYTYDSSGSSDGIMPGTLVPAGGVGFAWAGLVTEAPSGSGSGSGSSTSQASQLAKTGLDSAPVYIGSVGIQLLILGIALYSLRRRKG